MLTIPFALSIHKFINSVGADVGFASIIAVALLVILYFAHARETATLRERLDEAHGRIANLEARLAQVIHAQAAVQRGRGPVPGGTVPVAQAPVPRPAGSAIPSVRRIPNPATAAGAGAGAATVAPPPALAGAGLAGAGLASAAVARGNGFAPSAPMGTAGPPLASATKLIPDPPVQTEPAPAEDTIFVPPPANGHGENGAVETRTLGAVAAAAPVPTATPRAPAGDAPIPATAPRAPAGDAPISATAPRTAAGGAPTPTTRPRTPAGGVPAPVRPPRAQIGAEAPAPAARRAAPRQPLVEGLPPVDGDRRRISGRLLPLLIGGVAVIVIIVGLIVITNTGGSTTTKVTHPSQTGASLSNHRSHRSTVPFHASAVKVSVLNGTAIAGLAADVGNILAGQGYRRGNITNAAAQTQTSTYVYYVTGKASSSNMADAQHVAKALKLTNSSVRAAGPSVLQSCATSPAGAALGGCRANVIVSVGADRADLATSTST